MLTPRLNRVSRLSINARRNDEWNPASAFDLAGAGYDLGIHHAYVLVALLIGVGLYFFVRTRAASSL